jgi:fucose 4-O-acetylase-like acetyltransferase
MDKQRIEYIDAMRGFTMILVVYSHVCSMCLGDSWMGYNDVFFLFRLPCFFFISGWLFNPLKGTFGSVTKYKFMVQIVPTLIFLLLLAPPPLFFSKLGATKGGYWFTFVLFEFFIVSMLSARFCKKWGLLLAIFISVSSFFYDAYYNRFFVQLSWMKDIVGFLSFKTWRFYLFFYMGILVKRHFDDFIQLTGKRYVIIVLIACFTITAYLPHYENVTVSYFIFAIGGVSGMIIIFTFFRYVSSIMSSHPNSYLLPLTSHLLCYIGTRTLDIYLLHYFFLPRFLLPFGESLRAYDCKPFEFFVALILALIIVAVCLLVSYIIRLSPFLGHYLFGVKY